MKIICETFLLLSLLLPAAAGQRKTLRVVVEGDTSSAMVESLRDQEDKYGLSFTFVEKSDPYDIKIVLVAEGPGYVNNNRHSAAAVVVNSDCKIVTAAIRSSMYSAKGATDWVAKEVVKYLAAFYGTKKKD